MKKILSILLSLSLVFVMASCGNDFESEDLSEIANPITECSSAQELLDVTGISIDAPKGATNITYSYIDIGQSSEEFYLAQVDFELNGKQYFYKAKMTNKTTLSSAVATDEDADVDDLEDMLEDTAEEGGEFAGLYDEWKSASLIDVAGSREGVVAFNKGHAGYVAWLDVAPGALYCLGMTSGSSYDLLVNTAEKCFVPMQGDVN